MHWPSRGNPRPVFTLALAMKLHRMIHEVTWKKNDFTGKFQNSHSKISSSTLCCETLTMELKHMLYFVCIWNSKMGCFTLRGYNLSWNHLSRYNPVENWQDNVILLGLSVDSLCECLLTPACEIQSTCMLMISAQPSSKVWSKCTTFLWLSLCPNAVWGVKCTDVMRKHCSCLTLKRCGCTV